MSFAFALCLWIAAGLLVHAIAYLTAPKDDIREAVEHVGVHGLLFGVCLASLMLGPLCVLVCFVRRGDGKGSAKP